MNNETINPSENKDIINEVPSNIIDSVPGNQDEESSNEIITVVPGVTAEEIGEVAVKSNTESSRFEFDNNQGSATNKSAPPVNEHRTNVHIVPQQ